MNYPDFDLKNLTPKARAIMNGSEQYPELQGDIWFYETTQGVLVVADIVGLPMGNHCDSPIFAMHIHDGMSCTGNETDPFANAGMHLNPKGCPHPYHMGDLPPLFSVSGNAFLAVLCGRFRLSDVLGKTIIIHANPDDFTTQPAGNSGTKIACGVIEEL